MESGQLVVMSDVVASVPVQHINVGRHVHGSVESIASQAITGGNEDHPFGGRVVTEREASTGNLLQ